MLSEPALRNFRGDNVGIIRSPVRAIVLPRPSQTNRHLEYFIAQVEVDFSHQAFGLETTPLAADGVLYVTGPNQVYPGALTGAPFGTTLGRPALVWRGTQNSALTRGVSGQGFLRYRQRPPACARPGGAGQTALGVSVGADLEGRHFGGTMVPLIVDGMVIAGVAGSR